MHHDFLHVSLGAGIISRARRQEAVIGLSSSKSKSTNAPSAYSQPFITAGADALGSAFNQAQPALNAASATLNAALPGAAERAFGANPTLDAATSYNNNVLGGKYLDQGNPHLEAQINATNSSVRDRVGAQFSAAGRTGSGANQYALGRALAENETNLRFTDYNNERGRMGAASGIAPSLEAGRNAALASYLQAAEAAVGLPMSAAQRYAGGIGSLVGGYNTTTSTQTPSLGMMLAQAAGNAASAYGAGGFR